MNEDWSNNYMPGCICNGCLEHGRKLKSEAEAKIANNFYGAFSPKFYDLAQEHSPPWPELNDDIQAEAKKPEAPTITGYTPVTDEKAKLVNENKNLEEMVLRRLDFLTKTYKSRDTSMARTHIEDAFMRMNRAIMQPQRIDLKEETKVRL